MKTELDRVACLLEEASKSLSAGRQDEAGNQLFEARGILEQALGALAPAAGNPAAPAEALTPEPVERKLPAA